MTNKKRLVIGDFPTISSSTVLSKGVAYDKLYKGTGAGSEMRGWLKWPSFYRYSEEYQQLKETANDIKKSNTAIVVVGIGGSYLTPKAVITAEYGELYNEVITKTGKKLPKIYFAGNDLSPEKLSAILEILKSEDWSIIYISKSGGTMEPALAFRILYNTLCEQYGDKADERVYTVTDKSKGILKGLADKRSWKSFVIPDDIGGRYSGFTACGLLPLAAVGIDTDKLLDGAIAAEEECAKNANSFAFKYAEWRFHNNYFGHNSIEFYAANTPYLMYLTEWLKQLFGESEGKDGVGIFPASGVFPTDLHSLGQFLQEGTRGLIMETFLIREYKSNIMIPKSSLEDNLESREGKGLIQASNAAMDGAYQAHSDGSKGNKCCIIRIGNDLESLGYLMQSMFVACATTSYMLNVNPFNQPGVEKHKRLMKESTEWS